MSVTRVYGNYSDNALHQLVKNGSVSKQIDALCEASGNGNLRLMRALCQSGISPHVLDGFPERRPLFIASKCQHSRSKLPLMTCLVKAGANINLPDMNNKSVLHYAMSDNPDYDQCTMSDNRDYDRIMDLIRLGANVNAKDKDNQSVLHLMVHSDSSYANIRLLIDKGADLCAVDNDGKTPLHIAAMISDEDIVTLLLGKGANVAVKDNNNRTPLHVAVKSRYKTIAKHLIDKGADVWAKDNDGRTPLHEAIQSVYEDIVRLLIDKDRRVCANDNPVRMPLHDSLLRYNAVQTCAETRYGATAKHLIDKGADICAKDNDGRTPLHVGVTSGSRDIVKHLIDKGAAVCAKDNDGRTPLHVAIQFINEDIVRWLIHKGVILDCVCSKLENGHFEIVTLMIQAGADASCLHGTCIRNNIKDDKYHSCDIIELLLDNGADVNAINKSGESPLKYMLLHYTYLKGNIVKLLIRHGALVGDLVNDYVRLHLLCAVKYEGRLAEQIIKSATPSELAYIECMLDAMDNDIIVHVCDCLIKHLKKQTGSKTKFDTDLLRILIGAADFKIRNHIFHCIIDHDAATESVVHSILTEHKSDIDGKDSHGKTLLYKAIKLHYTKIVQFLVKSGTNVNTMGDENSTALHQACTYSRVNLSGFNHPRWGILEIAKCLVKAGASVNAKDSKNSTPLHITLLAGNELNGTYEELSQFLIEHGADANAQDDYKRTPLHIATKSGCLSLTKTLLHDHAADVNRSDCYGTTPLHEAANYGTTEMINCLISHGADLYAKDCKDKTPMQDAIDRIPVECMEMYVFGETERDILLPFVEQRCFPADLMTSYIYGACVMEYNEYDDHRAFAMLHHLVQFGCGIDRKDELDRFLPTLFRMNNLYVLLYLMSAGLFPTMSVYRMEAERLQDFQIRMQTRCEKQEKPNNGKSFLDVLMDKFTKPQSLKLLCRDNIRQTLYRAANGTEIVSVIGDMSEIPKVMKSFLCLEGLNSMLSQSAVDDYDQYFTCGYRDYHADNDDHNDSFEYTYAYSHVDSDDSSYAVSDYGYDDYSEYTDDGIFSLFDRNYYNFDGDNTNYYDRHDSDGSAGF